MRQINVTYDHIMRGDRAESNSCPIALALREQDDVNDARVYDNHIMIYKENKQLSFSVNGEMIRFIHEFDAGRGVKPFSFDMELDDD